MSGILGPGPGAPRPRADVRTVAVAVGMRVLHRGSRVGGIVTKVLADGVVLRTPTGERSFRFLPEGFIVDGAVATLFAPRPVARVSAPSRTASGSIAAPTTKAKVARGSRLWVEGVHDAALLERVWGDDLRELAIVVERLDGLDHAAERVSDFAPGPARRLGLLVDHLVEGSKESRIAGELEQRHAPFVAVRGTPYVDIWQAVRPQVLGIGSWPEVPRSEDWKLGVCQRLGVGEPTQFWRRVLSAVVDYRSLEPPLIAAVEHLLDFLGSDTSDAG